MLRKKVTRKPELIGGAEDAEEIRTSLALSSYALSWGPPLFVQTFSKDIQKEAQCEIFICFSICSASKAVKRSYSRAWKTATRRHAGRQSLVVLKGCTESLSEDLQPIWSPGRCPDECYQGRLLDHFTPPPFPCYRTCETLNSIVADHRSPR